jgi:hypothetical protein
MLLHKTAIANMKMCCLVITSLFLKLTLPGKRCSCKF